MAGWMLSETGVGKVLDVIGRFGIAGFLAYCAYSLAVVALLGGAWAGTAPPLGIRRTFIADAILDRLVHNAYRIELTGESMRKRRAPENPEASQA